MTDHMLHSVSWPGLSLHLRGQTEAASGNEEIIKTYNIIPLASSDTEMQISVLYAKISRYAAHPNTTDVNGVLIVLQCVSG